MRNSKTWAMAAAAAAALTAAGLLTATALASPAHAAPRDGSSGYSVTTILNGANLSHLNSETGQSEALTKPDDLTRYRGHLYTAFQNGVGPQGEPASDGNQDRYGAGQAATE